MPRGTAEDGEGSALKFRASETSNAPIGRANVSAGHAGIAGHYVEPAGANLSEGQANASAGRTSTLRSHSECIVVRKRGLVRNAG